MTRLLPVLLLALCAACATRAPSGSSGSPLLWPGAPRLDDTAAAEAEAEAEADEGHGAGHVLLFWLPNRIFDVLDIVRARVRVGPGIGVDVRATELVDLFVGSYGTVYVGLPGPRQRRIPVLPVGFETRTGIEASVVDVTAEGPIGPDYGLAEVGLGLQLFLIGFDVGVDVFEVGDLVVGLFTFDPMDDDL